MFQRKNASGLLALGLVIGLVGVLTNGPLGWALVLTGAVLMLGSSMLDDD